jgi:mono/diheme cytochrome c family protein
MKTMPMLAVLAATASLPAAAQAPTGDATRGKSLYMKQLCYACHGTGGQGGDRGAGPRIAPNPFPWEAFVQSIRRPREVMPRYDVEFLSDQELADIYAYLVSIKPTAKAGEITLLSE